MVDKPQEFLENTINTMGKLLGYTQLSLDTYLQVNTLLS